MLASSLALSLIACGGDDSDDEAFATFQACFDDHHAGEGFDVATAIKICCLDHPIGTADANVVCGDTQVACETFVDANVDDADATDGEITAACAGYLVDREK
ncbi:MAG: hypothetical protein KF773_09420 [Deltaproteobacteria bacterium]|nr:hypothetical protein [Deltaproteobacteria bacterium]MCW5804050.1 hypothetical protein [Deltaproteobacteria bacterium]